MGVIIIFAFIFGTLLLLILIFKHISFCNNVLWNFKHCNVLVAGKKGSGKDLLFQWVINKRKDFYYANIPYTKKNKKIVTLKEVSCEPNSYDTIVNDKSEVASQFYHLQ